MRPIGVKKNHADIVPRTREQKAANKGAQILNVAVIQVLAYLQSNTKQKSIVRFWKLGLHDKECEAKRQRISVKQQAEFDKREQRLDKEEPQMGISVYIGCLCVRGGIEIFF